MSNLIYSINKKILKSIYLLIVIIFFIIIYIYILIKNSTILNTY